MMVISQKELCYKALINNALRLGNDCSEYEANLANKERLVHILDIDVKRDSYGYYLLEDYKIYVSYGINVMRDKCIILDGLIAITIKIVAMCIIQILIIIETRSTKKNEKNKPNRYN